MTTLRRELANRGIIYASQFSERAKDISFDTTVELCEALGYIAKNIAHIDGEYPEGESGGNMEITDGVTSGGNEIKWGKEWRVYLETTKNCPQKIRSKLHKDNYMRFGGSFFVEALLHCGFVLGNSQNKYIIQNTITCIFTDTTEQKAFNNGFNLVP